MSSRPDKESFPFRALMGLYQEPQEPTREYWQSLQAKAGSPGHPGVLSFPWNKTLWGLSGVAAAALLAVLFFPRSLELPVMVATQTVTLEEIQRFEAGPLPLELKTRGESLVLSPGSRMTVEPLGLGTAFHHPGNRYSLESGGLEIHHTGSDTTFELVTPFGRIFPLGTVLKAEVSDQSLFLSCTEGRIGFEALGRPVRYLEAGEHLIWPEIIPEDKESEEASLPPEGAPVPVVEALPEVASLQPSLPTVSRLWSRTLGATVEEAQVSGGRWILRMKGRAAALEARTGRITDEWSPRSDLWIIQGNNLVDYEKGGLFAVTSSGLRVWETPVPPLSLGRLGIGPSGILAASAEGSLVILDPGTGRERKRIALGAGSYGQALEQEDRIYLGTLDRKFHAWDTGTGTRLWSVELQDRLVGDQPLVWESLVLTKDRSGKIWAMERAEGRIRWSLETGQTRQPGMIPRPGYLFVQTREGTLLVDPQGRATAWTGGVVLTAVPWDGGWVTAEPEGLYLTRNNTREALLPKTLVFASSQGNTLALQGTDLELNLYTLEE